MQNKTANQTEHKSTTKYTCTRKKRKRLFEKGLKKIAKMQNLSQNELNQITKMQNLKSKQNIAELFNNNLDDDKIINIRGILNRLKDILPKRYRKKIREKFYEIKHNKNL